MPLSQTQLDTISVLKKATNVLVLPSSPVDGDSIGSALALYLALRKLGKKVTVVAEEEVPESYGFLPEISKISRELHFVRDFVVTIDCRETPPANVRHEIQGNKINIIITPGKGSVNKEQVSFSQGGSQYDCIVAVDAADPVQFGKNYENCAELFHLAPMINIDHHASNLSFGKINLVDIMASSTTMLILPLIEELGAPNNSLMDADIATLLLAGIITDTASFQNPNTTPDAFSVSAKLIGCGARQQEIIQHIYKTKKLSTLRLWGRTLSKIQNDEQHKLVWSVLTAKDFAEIGGSPDETEGVIDELMSNAPGAEIVFLLKEKGPQEIGGSVRTLTPTIDASKLAALFGGGGHTQAAGFRMEGKNIQEVEQTVVAALRDFQKKRLRIFDENATAVPEQQKPTEPDVPAPAPTSPVPEQPKLIAPIIPTVSPAPTIPVQPPATPATSPEMPPTQGGEPDFGMLLAATKMWQKSEESETPRQKQTAPSAPIVIQRQKSSFPPPPGMV